MKNIKFNGTTEELVNHLLEIGIADNFLNQLSDCLLVEQIDRTLYTIYLGINCDLDKNAEVKNRIVGIVKTFSKSFTFGKATGFFQGEEENTVLIQIAATNNKLAYDCAEALRIEFDQIGVGVVRTGKYQRVI